MANPHFEIKITKRSKRQSAVAGAAYQSGENLFSEYDQKHKDYRKKEGVVYTEVMLPSHPPGHNPHCHIMLTMRAIDENGKWLPKSRKVYDLDENGERIRLPSGNRKSHKENKSYYRHFAVAQKNYLCHSLHIPPQAFIIRYTALFSNVDSGYFSRISTLFSITFQQNGVVMVYQTVLYQPDIFRSCRSDNPGKSTSFAICSAAWS